MIEEGFWKNKRVFLTGHTGFKGSWLSLWLHSLGARVTGYSLGMPTKPSLFKLCKVGEIVRSEIADIRDSGILRAKMTGAKPEIVIHMAAQSLVLASYNAPVETYSTNVMGTVNVLEAVRKCKTVRAVIVVTSDKCYENKECVRGYKESDAIGGYDPYSSSKACSELVTSAYRDSFFSPTHHSVHCPGVSSVRAGNVIGGGDWSKDRIVADCIRAFLAGKKILIRNPDAVRPWQHVLEPLSGYLILAQKLFEEGPRYGGAWNFGPDGCDTKTVEWLVASLCTRWGRNRAYGFDRGEHPHETRCLRLDCSKARSLLGWKPVWNLDKTVDSIIEWTKAYKQRKDLREVCLKQIKEYSNSRNRN